VDPFFNEPELMLPGFRTVPGWNGAIVPPFDKGDRNHADEDQESQSGIGRAVPFWVRVPSWLQIIPVSR
jgi:hypothetical protein